MTTRPNWGGVLPSLPTLFDDDSRIDADAFVRVARFALERGAHGLVCFGLAGEVSRLTVEEREQLLDRLMADAAPEVPVLVGVTAEHLGTSQRLARHAERVGAAGIVIPPPTAYRLAPDELVDFFVDVASGSSLPAVVQDAPEYLGVDVGPESVLRAAERAPSIRAVKLETGPEGIESWSGRLGAEFAVFGGNGGMYLLDAMRAGADGVIPGVDTIDLQIAIAEAEREGRRDDAEAAFQRLLPLLVFEMQSMDHYNACAKHVLVRRGVDVPATLRAPGPRGLSRQSIERLEGHLERLELVVAAPR